MNDKVKIAESINDFEINVLKSKLDSAGIPSWILNKHDSAYNNFGDLELYVDAQNVSQAKELIKPKI